MADRGEVEDRTERLSSLPSPPDLLRLGRHLLEQLMGNLLHRVFRRTDRSRQRLPPRFLENLPQGTTTMYPHHLSRAPVDSQTTATRLRGQGLEEVGVADAVDEEVVDEVGAGENRAPF